MKYGQMGAFEKHLAGSAPDHFAPVYVILGSERAERQLAVEAVVRAVKGAKGEVEVRRVEKDVAGELASWSFFSPFEVIVAPLGEDLLAYLDEPSERHLLVLEGEKLLKTTKFYKKVEKVGVVLELAEEKPWERERTLAEWVVQQVQGAGKEMDRGVATALVQQVGCDRAALKQEVDKLVCYVGEKKAIERKDVQAVTPVAFHETIWQLVDALLGGDGAGGMAMMGHLLEKEGSPFGLLRLLRGQYQTLLQMALDPGEAAAMFPQFRGQMLNRKLQQAGTMGAKRLMQCVKVLDEAELAAKNGMDKAELLMEMVVARLVT